MGAYFDAMCINVEDPDKKLCESTNLLELPTLLRCELWLRKRPEWLLRAQNGEPKAFAGLFVRSK